MSRSSAPTLLAMLGAAGAIACASGAVHSAAPPPSPRVAVWGFTAPWDKRSDSSLARNASRLAAAVTGWIRLDSATGRASLVYRDTAALSPTTRRFAIVTGGSGGHFHPDMVRRVAGDDSALAAAAATLAGIVRRASYQGLVLDLEGQRPADVPLVARFVRALADSARGAGARTIALAIPAADTAAYPAHAFIPAADAVLVMLYDEHWPASPPGPIASPDWVRRTLAERVADVGAARVIAALPLYGYLWRPNQPATALSFDDARRIASQAGVEVARDPASLSLHAVEPGAWELWASDASQLAALRDTVASLGVTTVALWRLGLEDPLVWSTLSR